MKLRHLPTEAILIASLLAATVITVLVTVPKGKFKTVNSITINGWAYNSNTPDDAFNVRMSIKDKNTGEEVFSQRMTAGEYSDELYGNGKGNGCRAFTLDMNQSAPSYNVCLAEDYTGDSDFSSPRTYTNGNLDARQEAPAAKAQNLAPLGILKTTRCCPCGTRSESWGHCTSTDTVATTGHTIAVDLRVIPCGSKVTINDVIYTAEDRGGAVRDNHIDIFFDVHAETRQHDTQNAEVYLVQS